MTAPITERLVGMSMADFFREYDEHGPFELLNGEIIRLSPQKITHGLIMRVLFVALYEYCVAHALGEVFNEITFVLSDKSDWVKGSRVPDILFVSAERYVAYKQNTPDWKDKPLILVPDLAVEIVSPTDKPDSILEKIGLYLGDGVRLVWVIDPQRQMVAVYHAGNWQPVLLTAHDALNGEDILPGFSLPIATLLEAE
ncbi:MAG: Uma2 family endonuclease [Aggregatilineales bacterium]